MQCRCVAGSGPNVRPCRFGRVAQVVQHAAGLRGSQAAVGVDPDRPVDVFGEIHHDGDVAALASQARAAAAAEKRGAELPSRGDGFDHILEILRNDDADRNLPVIGAIGSVQGAASGIEADFTANAPWSSAANCSAAS